MPETDRPERRYHYPAQPPRPRRYVLMYKPYDVLSEFGDDPGQDHARRVRADHSGWSRPGGWTRTARACCCSRTTASWRTN